LIGQRSRLFGRQMGLHQQPFGNLRQLTTPPGTQTDIIPRATGSTDPAGKPTGTIPRGSSQEVQGHRKRHIPCSDMYRVYSTPPAEPGPTSMTIYNVGPGPFSRCC